MYSIVYSQNHIKSLIWSFLKSHIGIKQLSLVNKHITLSLTTMLWLLLITLTHLTLLWKVNLNNDCYQFNQCPVKATWKGKHPSYIYGVHYFKFGHFEIICTDFLGNTILNNQIQIQFDDVYCVKKSIFLSFIDTCRKWLFFLFLSMRKNIFPKYLSSY